MRIVIPDDGDRLFPGSEALERLRRLGAVSYHGDTAQSPEALLDRLGGAEIILTTRYKTDFKSTDILDRLPALRMISVMGTRPRMIDMGRARARGITVTVTPAASAPSVAEHTIMLLLALAKQMPFMVPAMKEGGWPRRPGVEVEGKTMGLLGFGNIGRRVCRMAAALGMRVLAWSKNMTPARAAAEGARAASLEECLGADFVVLLLHATPETRGLLSRERLARMKPAAYLVNTARAALVDMEALCEALRQKKIAGAGLDVFEPDEPLPAGSPLRALDNVLLTPHSAWDTEGTQGRFVSLTVDNIEAWLQGRPRNVVTGDA
ncbi:MAG: D-2-hydroxyacid dehydrogenase family protein [Candidatus Tectomicrobia bacterium]|uniref:D-2-hydroxyacid dehydrogenase family protein n=1 Tax=Tectimicrobiota bacterium TaxID=2528274 RepID=A0A932HZH8_UNCTE|nr:D-2-hydroxyacid dehydrogenase family protein [Candidatus Tectomicrobia bacterium]